jgi:lantibiotic leader peptide-processing serine protease
VRIFRLTAIGAAVLAAALATAASSLAGGTTQAVTSRYLVIAKSKAAYKALHTGIATRTPSNLLLSLPQINTDVVTADQAAALRSNPNVQVVPDRIESINPPDASVALQGGPSQTRYRLGTGPSPFASVDPAYTMQGLLWNVGRIHAPEAWRTTQGSPDVVVAVADTGLDYTHSELKNQVVGVADFTGTEIPNICSTFFGGPTDAQLAADLGAPAADLDFNGHGSWIGGNIAAALDKSGINGIAPHVQLYALKISQWCGSAYDSEILSAFLTAPTLGVDVISISFGGYLDRSDPYQDAIYRLYVSTVGALARAGTAIVASAGNEHVRVGTGGRVISHGQLVTPGDEDSYPDLFGQFETPGGIPGVVDVSSTGNRVMPASSSCPSDSLGAGSFQWCKPNSDPHQPFGAGKQNQLAYYSDYGPRIDVAGPGGARKFNLPTWDRGGTPGWPYTGTNSLYGGSSSSDGFKVFEDFSITSNWAQEIPCFTFNDINRFPDDQCYSTIQGTSMAAPHASATLALLMSAHPALQSDIPGAIAALKATAQPITGNTTPPVNPNDKSPSDRTLVPCPSGNCHLGGAPISDADAYGAGLVDAANAVK